MIKNSSLLAYLRGLPLNNTVGVVIIDEDDGHKTSDPIIIRELEFLKQCRTYRWPVWFVRTKVPIHGGGEGGFQSHTNAFLWRAAVGIRQADIAKPRENAFDGTSLSGLIKAKNIDCLVIIGAYYQSCIRQSVHAASLKTGAPIVVSCAPLVRGDRDGGNWHERPGYLWFTQQ